MRIVNYIFSLLILLLVFSSNSLSQNVEEIVTLFEEGRIEELRAYLPQLVRQYPDEPSLLFINGVLQKDAEKAINIFTTIVEKFPTSTYADDALFKVAQYYFSGGFYITARKKLQELLQKYPNSSLQEDTHYLLASCLLAMDEQGVAKVVLKSFLKRYPHSKYASTALNDLKWALFSKEQPGKESNYTLQIGAFSTEKNAVNQRRYLRKLGYRVEVGKKLQQGRILYLVWVGNFNDRNEAKKFGERMKERLGIDYRIVEK